MALVPLLQEQKNLLPTYLKTLENKLKKLGLKLTIFHTYLGKGLSEYVNELRLSYIDSLIEDGDARSITELIYDAGFGSQQTYYRERKKAEKKGNQISFS